MGLQSVGEVPGRQGGQRGRYTRAGSRGRREHRGAANPGSGLGEMIMKAISNDE